MRSFRFFINDERPGWSDFRFLQSPGELEAWTLAEQTFRESAHHRGVEVWDGEELIFVVGARPAAIESDNASGARPRKAGFA
jgi:hypothetical protein